MFSVTVVFSSTVSHTWNHTPCDIMRLAAFTQHNVLVIQVVGVSVVLSCWKTLVAAWRSVICLYHCLFNHLPIEGHLGWFQFLVILNKAAPNILVQIFCTNINFYFLRVNCFPKLWLTMCSLWSLWCGQTMWSTGMLIEISLNAWSQNFLKRRKNMTEKKKRKGEKRNRKILPVFVSWLCVGGHLRNFAVAFTSCLHWA